MGNRLLFGVKIISQCKGSEHLLKCLSEGLLIGPLLGPHRHGPKSLTSLGGVCCLINPGFQQVLTQSWWAGERRREKVQLKIGSQARIKAPKNNNFWVSLVAQMVKICLQCRNRVRSLSQEDPLEKRMATHSSILAWRIPWTEEPDKGNLLAIYLDPESKEISQSENKDSKCFSWWNVLRD